MVKAFLEYWRDLAAFAGGRLWVSILLMLAVALTEGIGLLLLVPLLSLIGVAGEGGASAIAPLLGPLIDGRTMGLALEAVLVLYVALVALRAGLVRARSTRVAELTLRQVDHLRNRLYTAIGHADWEVLAHQRAAELSHTLTSDLSRVETGTHALLHALVLGLQVLAYLAVALVISPGTTLIALLCGSLLLLLLIPQVRRAHRAGAALTQAHHDLFGNVAGFLSGIRLAKAHNAEARHLALFSAALDRARAELLELVRSHALSQAWFQVGGALALSLLVYLAFDVLRLDAAGLLVLAVIFARLLPMLSALQHEWQQIAFMLPAYRNAERLRAELIHRAESQPGPGPCPTLDQGIRLSGVGFGYHPEDPTRLALCDIDLFLPARHTIALIGASGAGKSTLADLVIGLLRPSRGEIFIDDARVDDALRRRFRDAVAYVPQEAYLFDDTVRANLLWARPDAVEDDLWQALAAASADGLVRGLPQGLDSPVGERGSRLSGGERQRLALARALVRRPQLLVLDEATSALDVVNEQAIQHSLRRLHGSCTVLIIAHRWSTVRHADLVVVLAGGRVTAVGSWEVVMANPGVGLALGPDFGQTP